jgi:hypothetical protein
MIKVSLLRHDVSKSPLAVPGKMFDLLTGLFKTPLSSLSDYLFAGPPKDEFIRDIAHEFLHSFPVSPMECPTKPDPSLEEAVMREVASWGVDHLFEKDFLDHISLHGAAMGQVSSPDL